MTTVLHIVRNTIYSDSRVLREVDAIVSNYPEDVVDIVGLHEPGFSEFGKVGVARVCLFRLTLRFLPKNLLSQVIKYVEWHWKIFRAYRYSPLKVIHCHDVIPLLIACHLKWKTGARLVYDAHELQSETQGTTPLRRLVCKLQESLLLRYVDQMITVSPSIVEWYTSRWPGLNVHLVRNIPTTLGAGSTVQLRERIHIPDDTLLFLYLGGLGSGRGIEAALEAFDNPNVIHHVLFMGNGPLEHLLKIYEERNPRIHWLPPVRPDEVLSYASSADVGICLYEDTCLNHRFCLPNKLFESILSGLPVLASELPDQAYIVKYYDAGWIIRPEKNEILKKLLELDVDRVNKIRDGLSTRASGLTWENELKSLLKIYRLVMRPNT